MQTQVPLRSDLQPKTMDDLNWSPLLPTPERDVLPGVLGRPAEAAGDAGGSAFPAGTSSGPPYTATLAIPCSNTLQNVINSAVATVVDALVQQYQWSTVASWHATTVPGASDASILIRDDI